MENCISGSHEERCRVRVERRTSHAPGVFGTSLATGAFLGVNSRPYHPSHWQAGIELKDGRGKFDSREYCVWRTLIVWKGRK